jgi:hypothetical protein
VKAFQQVGDAAAAALRVGFLQLDGFRLYRRISLLPARRQRDARLKPRHSFLAVPFGPDGKGTLPDPKLAGHQLGGIAFLRKEPHCP